MQEAKIFSLYDVPSDCEPSYCTTNHVNFAKLQIIEHQRASLSLLSEINVCITALFYILSSNISSSSGYIDYKLSRFLQ